MYSIFKCTTNNSYDRRKVIIRAHPVHRQVYNQDIATYTPFSLFVVTLVLGIKMHFVCTYRRIVRTSPLLSNEAILL